jgi:hypothetical protein
VRTEDRVFTAASFAAGGEKYCRHEDADSQRSASIGESREQSANPHANRYCWNWKYHFGTYLSKRDLSV